MYGGNVLLNNVERFWSKVQVTDGCWLWLGETTKGYGRFTVIIERGVYHKCRAHRFAWFLLEGDMPEDCQLHHQCEIKHCVRPDEEHVRPVSCVENIQLKAKR